MKKFLLLMLAVLLLTVSAVFAQETETVTEINWSDVESAIAEADISGDFAEVSDLGIMMWIPDVFSEVELDEEDVEDGYICFLTTEDEEAYVAVFYEDMEGTDLEDLMDGLSDTEGVADLEMGVINGIPALSYTDTENDALNVAMMTDKGYAIVFAFSPMSEEGFPEVAAIMVASIQTVEE